MERDCTIFNIPHVGNIEPAEIFVEKNEPEVAANTIFDHKTEFVSESTFDRDPEPRDIFETIYDSVTDDTSDIYKELNQIAEELEECRLRNC